jgi:hypothetical protein
MPIANNPQTGETVFLADDGSWQKAQTAVNPQTKQLLAHDGNDWVPVPVKSKGVLNYIDDAVRSVANGVTFGFADELAAKGNELLGRGTYDENVKAERAQNEQIPAGIRIPGEIAGAMAVPVGGLMGGATMGARALRGAGVGGAFGALAGAGEGTDTPSRAAGALVGGAIGAATGGAAVPVIEGTSRLGGYALSKPIEMIRSAINPDAAAERAVGRAYQGAIKTDPNAVNRLAPHEVSPGDAPAILDTLGGQGRDLARSAANISGEASDTLNRTLNDRYTGQTGRFVDWLNQKFAFPNANATQTAIDQVERTVNRPAYQKAYQAGDKPIWDDSLAALAEDPTVLAAMRRASVAGRAEETRQGFRPFKQPFDFTGATVTLKRDPNGNTIAPNLQYWDAVKRELDKGGRDSQLFAKTLRDHLDTVVPEYGSARAGAAAFFGAENALDAGQNYVTQNFATPETRAALAKMKPHERDLFQQGFVSRYIETINQTPDRADVVRRIYNSPAAREKVELALGPQNARELEAMLRVENIMQSGLRGVQGNSTTAKQLTQLGLAGAAGGAIGAGSGTALGYDPTMSGIAGALTAAGKSGVDRRVAERVARLLVSDDPAMINRAVQSLAASPRLMNALRAADSASAKAVGSQSGVAIPALQGPAIGRAQDDQPTVPRPPGQ